jgi:hypothetical protein
MANDRGVALDFFIIGVQKCGTTALDTFLRRAGRVQMADSKELHFFDNDAADWRQPDYRALHARFSWAEDRPVFRGEATPIYIFWPNALERLQRYNPRAKLIVCLRHPAYRAHSQWRMEMKRGWESMSFKGAISEMGRRRARNSAKGVDRVFSYVERGFYAPQLIRLFRLFPREQIHFVMMDELWRTPASVVDAIHRFLGVGSTPASIEKEYLPPMDTRDVGAIPARALEELTALYADDIIDTARLTGLPLQGWLSPEYAEAQPRPFHPRVTPDGRDAAPALFQEEMRPPFGRAAPLFVAPWTETPGARRASA